MRVVFILLTTLFAFHSSFAQEENRPKSVTEIISENDTSGKNIPSDLPLDKQASIYAKRQAKKLDLDNIQVLRLTVRRLAYLKKMQEIQNNDTESNIEAIKERVAVIRKEYYLKFYELLNEAQRRKALQSQGIAKH